MKLFFKILLSTVTVLTAVLCCVESYMVSRSFSDAMSQEVSHELEQYRFIRMAVYLSGEEAGREQLGERHMRLESVSGRLTGLRQQAALLEQKKEQLEQSLEEEEKLLEECRKEEDLLGE